MTNHLLSILIIGIGATALLDLWMVGRQLVAGVSFANYGLVGRWLGYMPRGRFVHASIAASAPVPGERFIGWLFHYVIGIVYAAMLVGVAGTDWLQEPTPGPALLVGIATVAAPYLLMNPGMGAGIAASRTPRPWAARLQSLLSHAVFGLSLYLVGWLLASV